MIFSRPGEVASISQFVVYKWLAYQDMQGGVRGGKLNASPNNIRHRSYHGFIFSIIQLVFLLRLVWYDQWVDDVITSVFLRLLSCWQLVSNSNTIHLLPGGCVSLSMSWTQWSFQNHHHSCNNSHYQCHNQSLFNWHHHYHQQSRSEKDFFIFF